MKFSVSTWTIKKLYELIKMNKVDLRPSYQRNFIWGKSDQQKLIDSILKGWPLPTFFIFQKSDGKYEMVDGQQRAETICRFIAGSISDSNKNFYKDIDTSRFLNFSLNFTEISELDEQSHEDIASFYALVNKQGRRLNDAEIFKAQYGNTKIMNAIDDMLNSEEMSQLDLFKKKTKDRMNDRALVEELVAYLRSGFYDKRDAVENMYDSEISSEEIIELKTSFNTIIKRIAMLNVFSPINETRFRQRGDFLTLFSFIRTHLGISDDILKYQYQILLWLDRENLIRPSNEDCELLFKYAINCVSQSNSKVAREKRLQILEQILCHQEIDTDYEYEQMIDYLKEKYPGFSQKNIGDFYLISV